MRMNMKVLAVFFVLAVSFAASADGFVRQREVRDYMPKYGPYQHESDITEEMREEWRSYCRIIPPNVYFTMMETDPVTHEPGYEPTDLTCGGEICIPPHTYDKDKGSPFYDSMINYAREEWRRQAIIATNECLRALEPVKPWPELKKELDRYKMRAYEIDFWGKFFGCLAYESPSKKSKLPILVYIPGYGEIGEDFCTQFHQRRFFDLVTSRDFQKKYPCHLIALSPYDSHGGDVMGGLTFSSRAYRMIHKVAKEAFGGRVDWSRIYLVGFSYGGTRVFDTGLDYLTFYAAGLVIAGAVPTCDWLKKGWDADLPPLNFWYVANENDCIASEVKLLDELKAYVNSNKGDFRVTYFKGEPGHNAWDRAWESEYLWKWLFSKKCRKTKLK